MTTKFFNCTCRYCGATFQKHRSTITVCDNADCKKKAKAEADRKYRSTEKGKETRYKIRHTDKAKETRKRYEQTEGFKKSKSKTAKKYRQKPHAIELDKVRKLRYYYRKCSAKYKLTQEGADVITLEQFKTFFESDVCYYCGKPIENRNKTIDHKTPIIKGGTNAIENLCVCCQSCNSKKHDKTEAEFKNWLKGNN